MSMTTTKPDYQPRHAGGVGARRSEVSRALVDLERALVVLNTRIDQDDLTAIGLFLELRPLLRRRNLARLLVSA